MKKVSGWIYRFIRWLVWVFYPKLKVEGAENLPDEPCIVVSNHAQMNGPIACQLYFPGRRYIWCAGEMMAVKEVPVYAFQDFWSQKPRYIRWFYRLLSYIIAPFSACVFNHADTIAVYHDTRILSTFKNTVARLQEGANVIIFPEHDVPYNHILCRFQDRFIDVAKLYYKRTGKCLSFVPMYIAPGLKKIILGKPIVFCPETDMEQERKRICQELMRRITEIAVQLPEHKVVPYRNIPRKYYPSNKEERNEKAGN